MDSTLTSSALAHLLGVEIVGKSVEIPDFDRNALADLFAELGYVRGAEVGTERGVFAEKLCRVNPDLRLSCVDPWTAYRAYREHVTQSKLDTLYDEAVERLAPYDVELIREFSPAAAEHFEPGSLDFVYVDGNHELSHVVADISAWAPKVRKGGIVAGHDYIRRKDPHLAIHVVEAVHAYVGAWHIHPLFIVGTKAQSPGLRRDSARSWFWVVE